MGDKHTFYCPGSEVKVDETFSVAWGGWDTDKTRGQLWISYQILAGSGENGHWIWLDRNQTRPLGDAPWFRDGAHNALRETDVTVASQAPFLADAMPCDDRRQFDDPGVFAHNHSGYLTPVTSSIALQRDSTEGFTGGNTTFFDGSTRWREQSIMDDPTGPMRSDYIVAIANTYYAF